MTGAPPAQGTRGALRPVYDAAVRLLRALVDVAPPSGAKALRALRARRGLVVSYQSWAKTDRDASRGLVWFHAPSVGEGLQATPVMALTRERRADLQIAYTFFSPSAEPFASRIPADFRAYLPFDHPLDVAAAIEALRPTALVFCKSDVWPNLVEAASDRGVRLALVSASLPARSARLMRPASTLLRDSFSRLDAVGAIDADDAERLITLGVNRNRISVTGDTRFDQVWERANLPPSERVVALRSERPTLVAGSTWPSDEDVLGAALVALRFAKRDYRVIIAPHEVTEGRVAVVERMLRRAGFQPARLSADGPASAGAIVVDRYGVLGDIYAVADVAYVGGGFHRAGLHSVLEPSAFGVPVIHGPRHDKSREAVLLAKAGGGFPVASQAELGATLWRLLSEPDHRARSAAAARELVRAGTGAAERTYALIGGLIDSPER